MSGFDGDRLALHTSTLPPRSGAAQLKRCDRSDRIAGACFGVPVVVSEARGDLDRFVDIVRGQGVGHVHRARDVGFAQSVYADPLVGVDGIGQAVRVGDITGSSSQYVEPSRGVPSIDGSPVASLLVGVT